MKQFMLKVWRWYEERQRRNILSRYHVVYTRDEHGLEHDVEIVDHRHNRWFQRQDASLLPAKIREVLLPVWNLELVNLPARWRFAERALAAGRA